MRAPGPARAGPRPAPLLTAAREPLRHVYWIGGGSGSGKSSIARRLAADHGLRVYATDDSIAEHASQMTPKDSPAMARFKAMDMDERWLNRSPEVMLDTFPWFRGEGFDLVAHDIVRLPPEPPVVAEGFRLLPHLVRSLLADTRRAVWLLPTPEARYAAFERRGSLWSIAGRTSDPEKALRNLLERDRMFTARLADETRRLGLHAVAVDADTPEDEVARRVREGFGLPRR